MERKERDTSELDSTKEGKFNDSFLELLSKELYNSSIRSLDDQMSESTSPDVKEEFLRQKEKFKVSHSSHGLRHSFIDFLKSHKKEFESFPVNNVYLIESSQEGEVFAAENFLFFSSKAGCTRFKIAMNYDSWEIINSQECSFEIEKYYANLKYVNDCDFVGHSKSDYFVVSHINESRIETKVLLIICKNVAESILD